MPLLSSDSKSLTHLPGALEGAAVQVRRGRCYEKCLVRPAGQIGLQAIVGEEPTRRAIFEYDKLVRGC